MRSARVVELVGLLSMLGAPPALAVDECADEDVVVRFGHKGAKERSLQTVTLSERQPFRICVTQTYPLAFDYLLYDVSVVTQDRGGLKLAGPPLTSVLVPRKDQPPKLHDSRYRGYILEIRRKPSVECTGECGELQDVTLVLEVPDSPWQLETAGAFTASGLTDRQYFTMSEGDATRVFEDSDARDAARIGVAAFAHVRHRKLDPWILFSFGLGVDSSGGASYYFGTGLRLGGKASLTGGGVLGPVNRLPAGVGVGGTVADPASLGSLPTRMSWSWYAGLSFSFTGSGLDTLAKPFAPTPAPPARKAESE